MKVSTLLMCGVGSLLIGCADFQMSISSYDPGPYVDAAVALPREVRCLIADHVDGYSMPRTYRYSESLFPYGHSSDPDDAPYCVRSDFNGDYLDDYAMMFSRSNYKGSVWELTTKLLVVVSTPHGYILSTELILGTVEGSANIPIQEYWAIGRMKAGTHTISTYYNGVKKTESVRLDDDAFYLTSLAPNDRSLFYVVGVDTYEMGWDNGALAKRKANVLAKRAIPRIMLQAIDTTQTNSAQ